MAASTQVSEVKVEDYVFPPTVKAPGSDKSFFLGGAGVRGMEIEGKFVKFTAIGVYLEECGISSLAAKWKGKCATDLANSPDFFRDLVTGPFEKFTQVTMILPLTGQQYSEKVSENCVAIWKAIGVYTNEEAMSIDKFLEAFKDEKFPPGHSIVFTQSPLGSLTIGFCKHDCIPEAGNVVIVNKNLSEAVLESIIGEHGVSPEAKQSLAARVAELLNQEEKATLIDATNAVANAKVVEGVPVQHDVKA
ncbi:Chalcone--flavonone isomerase [Bienertia sinuspersici]